MTGHIAASFWIPVSDEMPPPNRYVLVWDTDRGLAMIAKFCRNRWFSPGNNVRKKNVSHWAFITGPDNQRSAEFCRIGEYGADR